MKKLFNLIMILLVVLMCSSLSGCFLILGSPSGNGTGRGASPAEKYEYKFSIAGDEFAFVAEVTSKNDITSADVSYQRNGKVIKEGSGYKVENGEISMYGANFTLSDGGKLLPLDVVTGKQSEVVYSYEMLAGSYAPSHDIYGHSGSTTLVLESDGTATIFDGEFTYYPMYNDTVAVFNAENDGVVMILDYTEKSYELVTKTARPIFDGGEYIESYYDFLYDCEQSYEGTGSFDGYTLKILGDRYYLTDLERNYTLGRAALDGDVLTVYTSESDSYRLKLNEETASFDYALAREFTSGNYYVNIYYNGDVYIQTLYTGGECRIVCELGEGKVPALYHIMTDTTYVFDDELNAVASFDGEYYVDSADGVTYTSVVADTAGNKPQILVESSTGTAYQIKYSSYGYPQYTRDDSAEQLADNLMLINSAYYFLFGNEYFSLYSYEMGTVSSDVISVQVVAVPEATIHTESDNLYKDDTVQEIENAYCALITFEDKSATAIIAQVVPDELYGEKLESQLIKGSLIYMDGSLAVINGTDRTTFVEFSASSVYVRRTYPKLQSPDLFAQNDKYYAVKSGSTYYVFDKDFILKYEIAENDYTGLDALE